MAASRARPPVVTNARVFAIAGPTMLANLTTPMLGIVGTAAVGRLGEAHLLGGVAMSAPVYTASTPSIAAAAFVSIDVIRPWAMSLRLNAMWRMPTILMSST